MNMPELYGIPADDDALTALMAQIEPLDILLQENIQGVSGGESSLDAFILPPESLEARAGAMSGAPDWVAELSRQPAPGRLLPLPAAGTPLGILAARFMLSPTECQTLLLSALQDIDSRYGLLLAYIQGDTARTGPCLPLLLTLLTDSMTGRSHLMRSMLPDAPLFYHGLITGGAADGRKGLRADTRILHFLLGHDVFPPELEGVAQWLVPPAGETPATDDVSRRLAAILMPDSLSALQLVVRGTPESGRETAAARAATLSGRRVLSVDLALFPDDHDAAWAALLLVLQEQALHDGWLLFQSMPAFSQAHAALIPRLAGRLNARQNRFIVLGDPEDQPTRLPGIAQLVLNVDVPTPAALATQLRNQTLHLPGASAVDFGALLERFSVSPDALPALVQEAGLYRLHGSDRADVTRADFHQALRVRNQQNFGKLARRVEPGRTLDDLIISDGLHTQLGEMQAAIRHRSAALNEGFAQKVGYGTGISALFYGESGTGKSMAAEVLAGGLGVDLIRVDLSTVVNKYIGETEKNLARIFDMAAADAGVLFFDEADALFGKRSEVTDAHDRHANIEVSYLLQRLESYPGLVVLATNNRAHLDEAFSRRITFMVEFTSPDPALREKIWRSIWPASVQLAPDVDFASLARETSLTGASIRNVALLASWLSREDAGGVVSLSHIRRATRRELGKLGRIL